MNIKKNIHYSECAVFRSLTIILFITSLNLRAQDSVFVHSNSLGLLTGPVFHLEETGGVTLQCGFQIQRELSESYFLNFRTNYSLKSTSGSSELLFSNVPFQSGRFISYKQQYAYFSNRICLGYYAIGYGNDPSNIYIGISGAYTIANRTLKVEDYPRDQYEYFPESGTKRFDLVSLGARLGYNNLVSSRIELFAEAELLLSAKLSASGDESPLHTPAGNLFYLNFGFKFFMNDQSDRL